MKANSITGIFLSLLQSHNICTPFKHAELQLTSVHVLISHLQLRMSISLSIFSVNLSFSSSFALPNDTLFAWSHRVFSFVLILTWLLMTGSMNFGFALHHRTSKDSIRSETS